MEIPESDPHADLKEVAIKSRDLMSHIAALLEEAKKLRVTNHGLTYEREGLMVSTEKLTEDLDNLADLVRTQQALCEAVQHRLLAVEAQMAALQPAPGASPIPSPPPRETTLYDALAGVVPVQEGGGEGTDRDEVWIDLRQESHAPIRGRMPSFPPPVPNATFPMGHVLSMPADDEPLC